LNGLGFSFYTSVCLFFALVFLTRQDTSPHTLEEWKQQAQELERRFSFTTKIIKALFLENTALVSQRQVRQMFSSSGSSAKDRDASRESTSKGSKGSGDTPETSKEMDDHKGTRLSHFPFLFRILLLDAIRRSIY
jgi:hypothetical protein